MIKNGYRHLQTSVLFFQYSMVLVVICVVILWLLATFLYDVLFSIIATISTALYVYAYKITENRYVLNDSNKNSNNNNFNVFIYLTKLIFFAIFIFFNIIALANWGFLEEKPVSVIFIIINLALIAALLLNINLEVFLAKYIKSKKWRICLLLVDFLVLMIVIVLVSDEGLRWSDNKILQAFASSLVTTSTFAVFVHIYFVQFKKLFEKQNRWWNRTIYKHTKY